MKNDMMDMGVAQREGAESNYRIMEGKSCDAVKKTLLLSKYMNTISVR